MTAFVKEVLHKDGLFMKHLKNAIHEKKKSAKKEFKQKLKSMGKDMKNLMGDLSKEAQALKIPMILFITESQAQRQSQKTEL